MYLAKTADAISELNASIPNAFGQHDSAAISSQAQGLVVGETPYGPQHRPDQIKVNSVLGMATGMYFVNETIPYRPSSMAVIEHRDPEDQIMAQQEDPRQRRIWAGRQMLSRAIADTLLDPEHPEDEALHYLVGKPTPRDKANRWLEIIEGTEELPVAIEQVFEIARNGLTFVIGNMKWPAELLKGKAAPNLVAIKANDLSDRQLLPGNGIWRTGHPDMPEVDSDNNEPQLEAWNEHLEQVHRLRVSRLEAAGIVTASVVFDPRKTPYFMDVKAVDNEISGAVRRVQRKLII